MQKEAREKLEHQISENVTAFLGPVLLPKGDTVSATLDPPELAHAKNHFLTNPGCDLEGSLQIVSQRGEQALRFRTLMPFKEIFLRFSPKAPRAACYTWPARLLETPGFRFVQRASGGDKQTFWRLGLDDGGYVEGKIHPEAKAPNPCTPVYLGKNADYPDWIIQILREQGVFRLVLPQNPPSGKQNPGDAEHVKWTPNHVWQIIHEEAQKRFVDGLVTDDQEARHTVMGDYWFCFRSNLPQLLTHILLTSPRLSKEERTLVFQRLDTPLTAREPDSEDAGLASRLWQILRDEHAYIAHGLGTPRNGTLQWVDFLNPVDAASARTQFMKFASRSYDRVPISRRQTHPSFNGLICPVQTPESKRVGLSLHLSRTAKVEPGSGSLLPTPSPTPADHLGFAAGLVPFFQHNDGARNMMAAKNLRQAVPLANPDIPLVCTSADNEILQFNKDLIEVGVCPACQTDEKLALGKNLLVAYMPWQGFNTDDAIVIGQHVVDSGDMNWNLTLRFRAHLPPGYEIDPGRTPGIGDVVPLGGRILCFANTGGNNGNIASPLQFASVLKDLRVEECAGNALASRLVEYELETELPLGLGDKLMGRHGNKGVIGKIESQMPRLPDREDLGDFSGRPIDLLLNPHGVISRMNLGQLLETQVGWLIARGADAKSLGMSDDQLPGEPFGTDLHHDQLSKLLEKSGLDSLGRISLELPNGEKTLSPVLIGVQHIVRLKHVPFLKAHARGKSREYLYSPITGQPSKGKRLGGGQRIGEMETWALAAHQADSLLSEIYGSRSTRDLSDPRFASRLEDHLFALRIGMKYGAEDNVISFSFLNDDDITSQSNGRVSNTIPPQEQRSYTFGCQSKKCAYQTGKTPILAGNPKDLQLEDLFVQLGLQAGPLNEDGLFYYFYIDQRLKSGKRKKPPLKVLFCVEEDTGADTLRVTLVQTGEGKPFMENLSDTMLQGRLRVRKSEAERYNYGTRQKNLLKNDLIQELLAGRRNVGELSVRCAYHPSRPLVVTSTSKATMFAERSSLYDKGIFGSMEDALEGRPCGHGHISLPVSVPYPVKALVGKMKGIKPPDITNIPVLPLCYRIPHTLQSSVYDPEITRKGYNRILYICSAWDKICAKHKEAFRKEGFGEEEALRKGVEKATVQLAFQVEQLFKMIAKSLPGKEGLIRQAGLGKRVDDSARLVIVPDPTLEWEQVGLPAQVILELFRDEFASWLTKNPPDCIALQDWKELLEVASWTWRKKREDVETLRKWLGAIERFTETQKPLVVLNRQPSLHKYSMQSFRIRPNKGLSDFVMRIHPLCCAGFGADFDGDEMTVHKPVTNAGLEEAENLLPRHHLLSQATGRPSFSYDQDFVLGTHLLLCSDHPQHASFMSALAITGIEISKPGNQTAKDWGLQVLRTLCLESQAQDDPVKFITQWYSLALEACTHAGVSFSFVELRQLANDKSPSVDLTDNDSIRNEAIRLLEEVQSKGADGAGYHFANMALSGARGGSKQVAQILVSRGTLSAGDVDFLPKEKRKLQFQTSLVQGLDLADFQKSSLNTRSSMCDKNLGTAHAGYLTRRLAMACYHVTVCEDCRAKERGVLHCGAETGICAACFGELPDGSIPEVGLPIGLLAALSVGERGTQLSMQSFHTGHKAISIHDINAIFDDRSPSFEWFSPQHADAFVQELQSQDAYRSLDKRWLQVVWKTLSKHGSLRKTLNALNPAVGLAFERQLQVLLRASSDTVNASCSHPVSRMLFKDPRQEPLRLFVEGRQDGEK